MRSTFVGVISEEGGGSNPPVLAIAQGLCHRGHRVIVVCDRHTAPGVAAVGAEPIPVPESAGLRRYFGPDHFGGWGARLANGDDLSGLPDPFQTWASASVAEVVHEINAARPGVVFGGLLTFALANRLADRLGLPWVFVNPAYVFGPSSPRSIDDDFAPGVPRHLFRQWILPGVSSADLVIHATDREFDPVTRLPGHHHQVGPLAPAATDSGIDRFDTPGDPWALVSISTEEQGETDIVVHAIDALHDQPLRVLVTAPGRADALSDRYPNIRVEPFVPHDRILTHSRLFVTHAGHGSVMRGLTHGVPMVLVPWGRDQPGVAHRAAQLGFGVIVERGTLSAATMRSAVQRVVHDTGMADTARRVAARLRDEDPVETTCTLLEQITPRHIGRSSRGSRNDISR